MSFLHCLSNWSETAKDLFKHPKSTRLLTIKPRYVYGTGRVIEPTNKPLCMARDFSATSPSCLRVSHLISPLLFTFTSHGQSRKDSHYACIFHLKSA